LGVLDLVLWEIEVCVGIARQQLFEESSRFEREESSYHSLTFSPREHSLFVPLGSPKSGPLAVEDSEALAIVSATPPSSKTVLGPSEKPYYSHMPESKYSTSTHGLSPSYSREAVFSALTRAAAEVEIYISDSVSDLFADYYCYCYYCSSAKF
jgi:hypothetical protein